MVTQEEYEFLFQPTVVNERESAKLCNSRGGYCTPASACAAWLGVLHRSWRASQWDPTQNNQFTHRSTGMIEAKVEEEVAGGGEEVVVAPVAVIEDAAASNGEDVPAATNVSAVGRVLRVSVPRSNTPIPCTPSHP
jgi:hypothetical protein